MYRLCALSLVCLLTLPAAADNWAHWRGPEGNGTAPNANPPTTWNASKNVKWVADIPGRGSGSPAIWENRVFVVTAVATAGGPPTPTRSGRRGGTLSELDFRLLCFDRKTGRELWQRTAVTATPHQGTHSTNGFASASPCTDGKHVYAHFGSRGLYCYTLEGELVWERTDFGKMETRSSFGEGSSPTLVDGLIIVPWDHEGPSALHALDPQTGETVWRVSRDEPSCWATPLIVEHDGRKQIVMNGQNYARAYDLKTGQEIWRCGGQTARPVASAASADGMIFIGSGFRGSFLGAFRPDGTGDIAGTQHVVWSVNKDTPDIASPLLSGTRLYYHSGKSSMITCVDAATGKEHFVQRRVPGLEQQIYASPIATGGHVYLTDRSGTTVVIKDADEFEIVATNSVGETVDASLAPVDDQLFIRGENHLFCIQE